MKTIVVLMFICCLSFTSFNQNEYTIKLLPRIDFDDFRQLKQPDYNNFTSIEIGGRIASTVV